MRLEIVFVVLFLILVPHTDCRRSRDRSRGSSRGSSTFWNRKNSKSSSEPKQTATQNKPVSSQTKSTPSAPKETEIKKDTAKLQQSSPNSPQNSGRPIGWDTGNGSPHRGPPPPYSPYPQSAGAHPHGLYSGNHHNTGGYPGYGYSQNSGGYSNYPSHGYNSHMGGFGGHGGSGGYNGYGGHGGYGGYNGYGGQGGYGGYNGGYGGYGGHGGYNGGYGGYGGYGGHGGYGGYSQMPQQSGMMGSLFGGKKHGGFGGVGGLAPYAYGMKKSGGFFGKHAFRNVLGGLFVWYLVSGLMSTPYRVYNFYNLPKEKREEITLPTNTLTLCNENATNICVPGTTALCTLDNKILCVTTMSSATPCKDNNGELCVNSTIPCLDNNDPLCQNKTTADNTTTVNLPCFTNMTLDKNSPTNVTLPEGGDGKFCVTSMAEPDPSITPEEVKKELAMTPYIGRYASQFSDVDYSANSRPYRFDWNPVVPRRYGDSFLL